MERKDPFEAQFPLDGDFIVPNFKEPIVIEDYNNKQVFTSLHQQLQTRTDGTPRNPNGELHFIPTEGGTVHVYIAPSFDFNSIEVKRVIVNIEKPVSNDFEISIYDFILHASDEWNRISEQQSRITRSGITHELDFNYNTGPFIQKRHGMIQVFEGKFYELRFPSPYYTPKLEDHKYYKSTAQKLLSVLRVTSAVTLE